MSVQLIELIILGVVAFFVITKLISIMGSTPDDGAAPSYFGENAKKIKDVTNSFFEKGAEFTAFRDLSAEELNNSITEQNREATIKGLIEIKQRLSNFSINKMIKASILAFQMIIEAAYNHKNETLEYLIDKRFLENFHKIAGSYGIFDETHQINAKIAEAYMFGNNAFIKILFIGKTSYLSNLHEEWLFTKNVNVKNPEWHLTNIIKLP